MDALQRSKREQLIKQLRLRSGRSGGRRGRKLLRGEVSESDVARIISRWTGEKGWGLGAALAFVMMMAVVERLGDGMCLEGWCCAHRVAGAWLKVGCFPRLRLGADDERLL